MDVGDNTHMNGMEGGPGRGAVRRVLLRLLSLVLLVWYPSSFAAEAAAAIPTMAMRGVAGWFELCGHGVVTAFAAAAGWSLWIGGPHALPLASAALIATAVTGVQSLYWTVLPRQTSPGDKLPFALVVVVHAGAWLTLLRRIRSTSN